MITIKLIVRTLSTIVCLFSQMSDASLCKPNSEFKLDCNKCKCSNSGMEFSCTKIICSPLIYKDKYLIEENEKGYLILKPKSGSDVKNKDLKNDNDLYVDDGISNRNVIRRQRFLYPYIRDEISQDNGIQSLEDVSNSEDHDERINNGDINGDDSDSTEDVDTWGKIVPNTPLQYK